MTWWPGGNSRRQMGPQAREAQRADRKPLGVTRAGVGPAPGSPVVQARQVIISGSGSGWFIYDGAPGHGNIPIAYGVSDGVTTDLYGNALPSSGGVTSRNASGFSQLLRGLIEFGLTGISGSVAFIGPSGSPGVEQGLNIHSGTGTEAGAVESVMFLGDSGAGGTLTVSSGSDGNTYDTMHLSVELATAFTVNSTSPQVILSAPVAAGIYDIEVWFVVANTVAADVGSFAFTGPAAAANPQLVDFTSTSTGTGATVGYAASSTYTQTFTNLNATGNQLVYMRATADFTAAGTLAITGKETVAGNTITVFSGSKMVIAPHTGTPGGGGGGGSASRFIVYTPEQFGAVGNGIADDTAAVAAAVTAAGTGGLVYFSQKYLISSSLVPLASQQWFGPGTLLLAAATTVPIINVTSAVADVHLGPGLVFDGNQASQTAAGNSLVHFTSPSGVLIEDCIFQNSFIGSESNSTPAVQLRMPQNCRITGCYLNNVGYGIMLGSLNTDTTHMFGNAITNCVINTTGWDGIFLTENLGTISGGTPTGYLHGTVVADCRFYEVGDASVEVGSGNVGAVVSGCTMDQFNNTAIGNNGVLVRDSQDVTITGCTIRNYLKSSARGIYFLSLNGTGANGKKTQWVIISGCVIDTIDYGIDDETGVTGLNIDGCVINNFSQTSAGSSGVKLVNTSTFTVTGTTISNGSGTPGSNEGLELETAHDGTVSGCNFFNNRGNDAFILNTASFDITVTGNRFGPSNTGHALRIFDVPSHDISVLDNDLNGNNTGNGVILNATPGANIVVRGNNAVNPFGAETVAVPASGSPVEPVQHDRTYYVTDGGSGSSYVLAPTVAVLSATLSTGSPITSLPINALNAVLGAGTVVVSSGANTQTWTTTGAAVGATSIPVTSQTPNFAYPAGSAVLAGAGLTITLAASSVVPIRVPANSMLTPTYVTAPTWVVEGE